MRSKIYFRADASTTIGYGHFIRTLALADMLKNDFDCTFFTCHPTDYQIGEMKNVCRFVTLQKETHYSEFLSCLQGNEIVVLDNYFFNTDYQRAIKSCGCRLVCIDDMHDKHYVADVVINHGITNRSLFSIEPYTKLCLGTDWALLRFPFLDSPQIARTYSIEKVVICFGGSDMNNLTEKFVSFLQKEATIKQIIAITGDKYKLDSLNYNSKVSYKHNLSASEMVNILRESDIAFLPTSTVCLEALSQHVFVAAGYYIDNQKEIYTEYTNRNYIYPIGNLLELDLEEINYSSLKEKMSTLDKIDCSLVSLRYNRLFQNLFNPIDFEKGRLRFIDYRLLDKQRHLLIWKARNEECIRSLMAHSELISWESHLKFVDNLFSEYKKVYMAVYCESKLIGSVNIEYLSATQIERGIFILPKYWGDGTSVLIENTLSKFLREQKVFNIEAKILKSNSRSLHFHLKLGYDLISSDNQYDYLMKKINE